MKRPGWLVTVVLLCAPFVANTQSPAKARGPVSGAIRSSTALDVWIVERFRGAQLLPDSAAPQRSVAADASLARIESVGVGASTDTLFALHFGNRPGAPALERAGAIRLAGPTGTITPMAARLLARRPFRAPRMPRASNGSDGDWRYGWAYLSVLPTAGRSTPVATFRGWLLLDAPANR